MIKNKRTFLVTSENEYIDVEIPFQDIGSDSIQVTYYTDCVYLPLIYKIQFHTQPLPDKKFLLKLNMGFLIQQTKTHKKILDNIGVLNIKIKEQKIRQGILVTNEKSFLYVSLIE